VSPCIDIYILRGIYMVQAVDVASQLATAPKSAIIYFVQIVLIEVDFTQLKSHFRSSNQN
jgi:hypothetical protein